MTWVFRWNLRVGSVKNVNSYYHGSAFTQSKFFSNGENSGSHLKSVMLIRAEQFDPIGRDLVSIIRTIANADNENRSKKGSRPYVVVVVIVVAALSRFHGFPCNFHPFNYPARNENRRPRELITTRNEKVMISANRCRSIISRNR